MLPPWGDMENKDLVKYEEKNEILVLGE